MYTHIKLLGKTCYDHVYVQGEHLISAGWGLLISVAMFAINSCQSLADNYSFLLGFHTALHVKTGLLDMLYQKSLRMGVDVRNARGVGTVVNLQSNDASKVWMMPVHIHTL